MKVVLRVTPPLDVLELLRSRFPLTEFAVCPGDAHLSEHIHDSEVLIGGMGLTPEIVDSAPQLRWVQSLGIGMDRFFEATAIRRGIALTNARGVNAPSVAELTMAMILAFARRLPDLFRAQTARQWIPNSEVARPFELGGQSLLLVGFGEIARAITVRAQAFGMRITAVRRSTVGRSCEDVVICGLDQLDDLLRGADHVVLALPLTAASRHVIDRRRLSLLPSTAYLYNVGRGGLIDEQALVEALRAGTLAGAGLDVTEREPLPAESPLWDLPNVQITHHTGGSTDRFWDRTAALLVDNLERYQQGRPLRNQVDPSAGY